MNETKVKCPNCGSHNILYQSEFVFTVYKKIKKDGSTCKNNHYKTIPTPLDTWGYECEDCGRVGYFGDETAGEFEIDDLEKELEEMK